MAERRETLSEAIDRIAGRTGATPDFVARVRELFEKKGIRLDDDSGRYDTALEEAFERQALLRHTLDDARSSLSRLQSSVATLGDAVNSQLQRLQLLREGLRRYQKIVEVHRASTARRKESGSTRGARLVRGDRDWPVVPGPEGQQ